MAWGPGRKRARASSLAAGRPHGTTTREDHTGPVLSPAVLAACGPARRGGGPGRQGRRPQCPGVAHQLCAHGHDEEEGGPPARPRSSKTPREGRGPHEEKNRTPRSNRTAHALTRLVCTREATEARACDGENGTSVRNGTRPHGPPPWDSPRSVLGPARSCLNLSSREASLSLKAELPRVPGWDVPPSAPVAEGGRDWDRGRGAVSLALSAEEERAEGERGLPGLPPPPPHGPAPAAPPSV